MWAHVHRLLGCCGTVDTTVQENGSVLPECVSIVTAAVNERKHVHFQPEDTGTECTSVCVFTLAAADNE